MYFANFAVSPSSHTLERDGIERAMAETSTTTEIFSSKQKIHKSNFDEKLDEYFSAMIRNRNARI